MSLTRRKFIGTLTALGTFKERLLVMTAGFVGAAFRAVGIPVPNVFAHRRYRIRTDLGDIYLDSREKLKNGELSEDELESSRLELPAAILLSLASSADPPEPRQNTRVFLDDLRVHFSGKASVQDYELTPTETFAISFCADKWFPSSTEEQPLSLELNGRLKILFSLSSFRFPQAFAEWPSFKLMGSVWVNDRVDKRKLVGNLKFTSAGDKLVADRTGAALETDAKSTTVFRLFRDEKGLSVFSRFDSLKDLSFSLYWFPSTLKFELEPGTQIELTAVKAAGGDAKATFRTKSFQIEQSGLEGIALGSRESRLPIDTRYQRPISSKSTMISILAQDGSLQGQWPLQPSHVETTRLTEAVSFVPIKADIQSLTITNRFEPTITSVLKQSFSETELSVDRFGPGNVEPGIIHFGQLTVFVGPPRKGRPLRGRRDSAENKDPFSR